MEEENKKIAPASICDFKEMLVKKDIQAWYAVKHAIVARKQEVINSIIQPDIPFFHPDKKKRRTYINWLTQKINRKHT